MIMICHYHDIKWYVKYPKQTLTLTLINSEKDYNKRFVWHWGNPMSYVLLQSKTNFERLSTGAFILMFLKIYSFKVNASLMAYLKKREEVKPHWKCCGSETFFLNRNASEVYSNHTASLIFRSKGLKLGRSDPEFSDLLLVQYL